jgi:hypothetical protein
MFIQPVISPIFRDPSQLISIFSIFFYFHEGEQKPRQKPSKSIHKKNKTQKKKNKTNHICLLEKAINYDVNVTVEKKLQRS